MIQALLASTGKKAVGWAVKNVVGDVNGWLNNMINPSVISSPTTSNDGSVASFRAGRYKFIVQPLLPSDEDIKALDDFFEAYGYRVDRFQKPNIALRGTFTYVKTRDAVVKSDNNNAALQMAQMLNAGCKFWKGDIG